MILLVTLGTFAVVTLVVLSLAARRTTASAASERLRTIASGASPRSHQAVASGSGLTHVLEALGRFTGTPAGGLAQALSTAGIRSPNAALVFVGTRTLLSFGPALIVLLSQLSGDAPLASALGAAASAWGTGHALVVLWLRRRARHRTGEITQALPDTLDLVIICLEAGLGLNATIARVGAERAALTDPLSREIAQVTRELQSGRGREEALRALANRNGAEDLKSLVALIIQSDRLGASMTKTLRVHADLLRTKRRQRAEEIARKLPIKILLPLALFILPALFIVAAGPALMQIGDLTVIVAPSK